jgi:hypothetical protein
MGNNLQSPYPKIIEKATGFFYNFNPGDRMRGHSLTPNDHEAK